MPGGVDIAMDSTGDEDVNSSNIAGYFSVFGNTDRGAGVFAADDVQPNAPVNVNAACKTQESTVDVSGFANQSCHIRALFCFSSE